jgi:curved DNA-binding protein CbpA
MVLMTLNYYQILEVDPGADPAQIKAAFYRLARQYHPDLAGAAATDRFQKICAAYEVLKDPERRQQYDLGLKRTNPSGPDQAWDPPVVVRTQPAPPPQAQPQDRANPAAKLRTLIKSRKLAQAVAQAQAWVEAEPDQPEAIHGLALAYHRLGSELRLRGDPQARHYLTLALKTEPDNRELAFEIRLELAQLP